MFNNSQFPDKVVGLVVKALGVHAERAGGNRVQAELAKNGLKQSISRPFNPNSMWGGGGAISAMRRKISKKVPVVAQ